MKLDPTQPKSWHAFLDLLRPPAGYRLLRACGTTYGLSFEALVAALLAMDGRSAADVAASPVDSVIAATRLASKVRVLFHPGTIGGRVDGLPTRLVGALDTLLVPVDAKTGLFHPKVWTLAFGRLARPELRDQPETLVRIIVSSRNLQRSKAFEIGAVIDGRHTGVRSPVAADAAAALERWVSAARTKVQLQELLEHLRHSEFVPPAEGSDTLRLHAQGSGEKPIARALPARLGRAVLVSPFVRGDFLHLLLDRTDVLLIVSTAEALEKLDPYVIERLAQRRKDQKRPVLYVAEELGESDEGAVIESVHAKLLVADDDGSQVTFLGSANGTGPGWGVPGGGNVEAMLELRPGLGLDAFLRGFVFDDKREPRAWIREFETRERPEPAVEDLSEVLLATLKRVGVIRLEVTYDGKKRQLGIALARGESIPRTDADVELGVAPLARMGDAEAFVSLASLASGPAHFGEVELVDVCGFVALRARKSDVEQIRITLADLRLARSLLDERDEAVRAEVLESVSPEELFRALVLGSSCSPGGGGEPAKAGAARSRPSHSWFERIPLERVLRAVAEDPSLVEDVRRLLAGKSDDAFRRFCDNLEAASLRVKVTT